MISVDNPKKIFNKIRKYKASFALVNIVNVKLAYFLNIEEVIT